MDVTLTSVSFFPKDTFKGLSKRFSIRDLYLVIFVAMMATMLSSVEALPHRRRHRTVVGEEPPLTMDTAVQPPWWFNPCGVKYTAPVTPERHGLSRSIRPLKTQMKNAMNHFRRMKSSSRYCNINVNDSQFSQDWLPGSPFKVYQREYAGKSRHEKIELLLPKLHGELQRFAMTFENLEDIVGDRIETAVFNLEERKNILVEIKEQMRTLLCEVETSLNNSNVPLPHRLEMKEFEENKNFNYNPNFTELCVQDMGITLAYETFLVEWQRVLNDIGRLRGGKELRRQQKRRADRKRHLRRRANAAQRNLSGKELSPNFIRRNSRRRL